MPATEPTLPLLKFPFNLLDLKFVIKNLRVSQRDDFLTPISQYVKTSLARFMILIGILSMSSHVTNIIENKRKYHINNGSVITITW